MVKKKEEEGFHNLTVRLPNELFNGLRKIAYEETTTLVELMREAAAKLIAEREGDPTR